jgi:hypothetical protein
LSALLIENLHVPNTLDPIACFALRAGSPASGHLPEHALTPISAQVAAFTAV